MTWFGNYYYKLTTISLICCKVLLSGLILAITFLDARDTITGGGGDSITDIYMNTLISAGNRFQLGFFALFGDSGYSRYVGIWYYNLNPQTIVWVANRNSPLHESSGVFTIGDDGNLVVMDGTGNSSYFSSGLQRSSSKQRKVQLLDSGNLVLSDHDGNTLWQSFDYPTDVFLPGMKMKQTLKLVSWKTPTDPFPGNFSFEMDEQNHFMIQKSPIESYWKSGESAGPGSSFDSSYEIPSYVALLLNISQTYRKGNKNLLPPVDINSRLRMSPNGQLEYLRWANGIWNSIWSAPGDACSVYNACGGFGSCSINENGKVCKCLPGFKPRSVNDWNLGDFSSGCERNTTTCSTNYTFLDLKMVKVGNIPDARFDEGVASEDDCKWKCLEKCHCHALSYSFKAADQRRGGTNSSSPVCWIWTSDLKNLQEHVEAAHNLSIRVALADIESTARNCKTCGANIIPYPLSTAPNCGDPMYQHFHCDSSTGQIEFQETNDTYRVTSVNPDNRSFVIQLSLKNATYHARGWTPFINISQPYYVINITSKTNQDMITVDIGWNPPPEPKCTSPQDCKDWPNSSCDRRKKRCLCNENYRWDGWKINCTSTLPGQVFSNSPMPSEGSGPAGQTKKSFSWTSVIISTVLVFLVVLLCISGCILYRRRKSKQRQENRENIQQNQVLGLFDTERRVKNFIDSGDFKDEDKKGIDVPFFDLESILAATNNFSDANKLGQGGFGPVYKGLFPGGQEIAVKRLSSHSGQGLEEFKNEVVLIAKLQHRNLVRLLGYCIRGDEKILLYEYMPNKSLDSFIFDQTLSMALDWDKRFDIILGIARGLLYLHQDSRLRIIHRDLKTSNILLDGEMNPKISDFGLARIVGGKETEANTNRVVGTYGYMSPEYALDGLFSIKSDVFSFGVIVLEIVSGKRNTGFYKSQQALHLLGYAWSLWKQDKALDLIDQTLIESCNKSQVLKCIIVGLLCVQEEPGDRPTMPNIVFMLGSETATLPHPKQPAFIAKKWLSNTPSSSSSKPETLSINEWTISEEEPR